MLQHKPSVARMSSIDAAVLHEHQTAFDVERARLEQEETRGYDVERELDGTVRVLATAVA